MSPVSQSFDCTEWLTRPPRCIFLHWVVTSEPAETHHSQLALTLESGCVYICMNAVLHTQSQALKQTGRPSSSVSNVSRSYH